MATIRGIMSAIKAFFELDSIAREAWSGGFSLGLSLGLGCGLVVLLLLIFLHFRRQYRLRNRRIHVAGKFGAIYLTRRAVRDMVMGSLDEFRDVTVKNVEVYTEQGRHRIAVDIEVAPGTKLKAEGDQMQEKVISDLKDLAGVTQEITVPFTVLSFAGSHRAGV